MVMVTAKLSKQKLLLIAALLVADQYGQRFLQEWE